MCDFILAIKIYTGVRNEELPNLEEFFFVFSDQTNLFLIPDQVLLSARIVFTITLVAGLFTYMAKNGIILIKYYFSDSFV